MLGIVVKGIFNGVSYHSTKLTQNVTYFNQNIKQQTN